MKFTKMHGCGNDYVYVDGKSEKISQEKKSELANFLTDFVFQIIQIKKEILFFFLYLLFYFE